MRCQDVDRYLEAFVDGEFTEGDSAQIEEHLKFCPLCRKKVSFKVWFKRGLKQSIIDKAMPKHLHAEISSALRKEWLREVPAWHKTVPAFAIILIFLGIFFFPYIDVSSPIVEATINRYFSNLPFDIQSEDSRQIEAYLHEKIKSPIMIPHFDDQQLLLMGGRVTSVQNNSAAYIAFHGNGRRYSMMAVPFLEGSLLDISQWFSRIVNNNRLVVVKSNGLNVVVWRANRTLYSVASDTDENELLNLVAQVSYEVP